MTLSTHHAGYQQLLELLRVLRQEAGLTQVELAHRCDNTQTFVSKVERGERRLDVVEFAEWCDALGVSPEQAFARFVRMRTDTASPKKLARRQG